MANVTNPNGSIDGLIFDVHKYFDIDNSGTHSACVGDFVADAFSPLADYLRSTGRKAMLSEAGASSDPTCLTDVCSAIDFLNGNADVYLGYIGWYVCFVLD